MMEQAARIRLMVLSATAAWCYWQDLPPPEAGAERHLRLIDLTGRPPEESLNGAGIRLGAAPAGDYHFAALIPGRMIQAVIGDACGPRFSPVARSNVGALPPLAGSPSTDWSAALTGPISYYAGMGPQ